MRELFQVAHRRAIRKTYVKIHEKNRWVKRKGKQSFVSAAAVAPLPRKIPFCAVGLSYFDRLLSLTRHSEITVFGLILVRTVGEPGRPTWAEISDDDFAKASNVSKEQYLDAINTLISYAYIKTPRRNAKSGHMEYAVADAFRDESSAKTVHGKCPHCESKVSVDQKFIPVPHVVLRKLGACLDPAAFACLMVILRYTLRWQAERGVYAVPEELDINDFERLTTYSNASISKALGRLCDQNGWALVQRKDRPGKSSIFCPVLENLFHMERREARVINQPLNRERKQKAKVESISKVETPTPVCQGDVIESGIKPYGFCGTCDRFVSLDPISEAEMKAQRAESPPRHGPQREKLYKSDVMAPGKAWSGFGS